MPGQRLSHPEQSTSRKVTALDDFAYRVWEQTKLSSDDFGVMPYSAAVLRADNTRLRKATERQVQDALDTLVRAELLLVFDHQGEAWLCTPVWQTWQKVAFPRRTPRPKPADDVLARCDEATRAHFDRHPGGKKKGKDTEPVRDYSENGSGTVPRIVAESSASRSRTCSEAGPAHANADANAHAPERGPGRTSPALIVSPETWWREHGTHVRELCDWGMCFPEKLAQEFTSRLVSTRGLTEATARDEVLTFARGVRASYVAASRVPTGTIWKFWSAEWDSTHAIVAPAVDPLAGLRAVARRG